MRAPMREQLEADLATADQTDDKNRETALDRVRALAYASPLGIALKRLHAEWNGRHLLRAISELDRVLQRTNRFARIQKPEDLTNLAKIAVLEAIADKCGRCQGRGWVPDRAQRIDCPLCHGSGQQQISDGARGRAFGRVLTSSQLRLIEAAHEVIRDHDALSGKVARHMVERS